MRPENTLTKRKKKRDSGAAVFNFWDKFNPEIPGIILLRELLMVHPHQPTHTHTDTEKQQISFHLQSVYE